MRGWPLDDFCFCGVCFSLFSSFSGDFNVQLGLKTSYNKQHSVNEHVSNNSDDFSDFEDLQKSSVEITSDDLLLTLSYSILQAM